MTAAAASPRSSPSMSSATRLMGEDEAATAYTHTGKMDEAKTALAEARRLNPAITVKWMIEHTPNLPAVYDGLRKAGMPEE
jgi:hypothetical protein